MRFKTNKIRPLDEVLVLAVIAAPLVIIVIIMMVEFGPDLAFLAPVLAVESTFRRDDDDEYIREGKQKGSKKKLALKFVKY